MKKYLTLLLLLVSFGLMAHDTTATSGYWNSKSTWSSDTRPSHFDTLVIAVDDTVTVNCNCGTYDSMYVKVYGTLYFPGGRKINMDAYGVIEVLEFGQIIGTNYGDKIYINHIKKWGGNQLPVLGYTLLCDAGNPLPIELKSVDVELNKNIIDLKLVTASEFQNDYFGVDISDDGKEWSRVHTFNGAYYSTSERTYNEQFVINGVHSRIYLRITQYDYDGGSEEIFITYIDLYFDKTTTTQRIYDMNGVEHKSTEYLPTGIYIINGTKVFIRG